MYGKDRGGKPLALSAVLEDEPHADPQESGRILLHAVGRVNGNLEIWPKLQALGNADPIEGLKQAFVVLCVVTRVRQGKGRAEHVSGSSEGPNMNESDGEGSFDRGARIGPDSKAPKGHPSTFQLVVGAEPNAGSTSLRGCVVSPNQETIDVFLLGRRPAFPAQLDCVHVLFVDQVFRFLCCAPSVSTVTA